MSRDINPFGLRMPLELRHAMENFAKENNRSLNAEIVSRLEQSVRGGQIDRLGGEVHELMALLLEKLGPQYKISIGLADEKDAEWLQLK